MCRKTTSHRPLDLIGQEGCCAFVVLNLEEFFGINARFVKFAELLDNAVAVFGISHTEPFARCIQDAAGGFALANQMINHRRDIELALQIFHILRLT